MGRTELVVHSQPHHNARDLRWGILSRSRVWAPFRGPPFPSLCIRSRFLLNPGKAASYRLFKLHSRIWNPPLPQHACAHTDTTAHTMRPALQASVQNLNPILPKHARTFAQTPLHKKNMALGGSTRRRPSFRHRLLHNPPACEPPRCDASPPPRGLIRNSTVNGVSASRASASQGPIDTPIDRVLPNACPGRSWGKQERRGGGGEGAGGAGRTRKGE